MKTKKPIVKRNTIKKPVAKKVIGLNEVLKAVDPSSSMHKTSLSRFTFKIGELNSESLTNYGSNVTRGS